MPDPSLTPGWTRTLTKQTICTTKWGRDRRFVTEKMKKQICANYGIKSGCPGPAWELDHLIPRELSGADDVRNVWPQPITEARVKDHMENQLHKDFCAGKVALTQAQEQIKKWWQSKVSTQQ